MKKIISLFKRNYDGNRQVYDEVVPGAEWVIAGEGIATRKHDGTACMVKDGVLYKRYDVRPGKVPPIGFIPSQDPDPVTKHWPGWVKVGDGPEDKWHREAMDHSFYLHDGTYELMGPKVQGNTEILSYHTLVVHGLVVLPIAPRSFDGIKDYLGKNHIEGIVWHHPDGRMVKIKTRDFGLPWPSKAA